MGIVFRVIDEDVTEHDIVGESALVPIKDMLSSTNKTHNIKILFKGKPAGDVTVETRFEVGAQAPPEQAKPKKGEVPRPQAAAISSNDDVLHFTFKGAEMKSDADFFTKMDPQGEIEFVGLPP